jgi:altronate dehydratase small subunit
VQEGATGGSGSQRAGRAPPAEHGAGAGGTARRVVHVLHPQDNVATALVDLSQGTAVSVTRGDARLTVEVRAAIPFGHKLAIVPIASGEPVLKYGEAIGLASADIAVGEHVHVHNVDSQRGRGDLAPRGAASHGEAVRGQAPQGQAPQGQAPQGEAPRGAAPQRESARG